MKQVGVLALQGAFIEHEKMLEQLGVSCIELRNRSKQECQSSQPVQDLFFLQKILKIRKKHTLEQSQCASNEMHMEDSSEASL